MTGNRGLMTDMQNHTVGLDIRIQHEELAFMIPTTRDPDNKRSRQQETNLSYICRSKFKIYSN